MRSLPALVLAACALLAAPVLRAQGPPLKAGEAFATLDANGKLQTWGDAQMPRPLGGLAKVVWLRLCGPDWASLDVYWDCRNPGCQPPKGHGKVNLAKAFRLDCDDAFLYWANWERKDWVEQQGEGISRMQLMAVFGPFTGPRVPKDGPLPDFTPDWMGRGDLLQASPQAFLAWLADPENQPVLTQVREMLKGFFASAADSRTWWFKPAACSQGTWVLAGDGQSAAVLFIAMPELPQDAVRRMQELLGLAKNAKKK
ncbi:MAG TPA: hypothetical protein VFM16_04950 [Holophagaceae bacterium]|nr:hypothetical protein [Holophagaceae bacterium]